MPYFQKSKGFQLRSGNKADAPFKMMGSSSPATFGRKKGAFDTAGKKATGTDINQFTKKTDATDLGAKDRKIVAKTPDKKEEAPKKHRDQIKKQEKITKLEDKEAKRDAKRADGKKVFLGNLKTKNNANKREKLQTEVDKTSEQYTTDKAAKKEERAQAFRDMGKMVSSIDPNKSMVDTHQEIANRKTNKADKDIQNEKDRVNTARTQQLVDATNKSNNESEKLSETTKTAVTPKNTANVTGAGENKSNKKSSVTGSRYLANKNKKTYNISGGKHETNVDYK